MPDASFIIIKRKGPLWERGEGVSLNVRCDSDGLQAFMIFIHPPDS